MPQEHGAKEKLVNAYNRMMERISRSSREGGQQPLRQQIDAAKEKAVGSGELTGDEAERVGEYVHRDVREAAHYLADTGHELATWMRFDLEMIEQRMWEAFSLVADQTRLQLLEFELPPRSEPHMYRDQDQQ